MAHNLMETEKGHAYAGAMELPWHNLGVTVDHVMTSEEAIRLAQLDYKVGIQPLYVNIPQTIDDMPTGEIEVKKILTHNATYNHRTGDVFGVVGARYEVVQNKEAFAFMDSIVGDKLAMFHTAGALGKGETIFITAKLPNNVRMKSRPDEEIETYLLLTSSHDGSGSIKVLLTPIRVVCNNTLTAALSTSKPMHIIKHTKNVRNRYKNF